MGSDYNQSIIYVVDDESEVRDSLTLLLESSGQIVRSFALAAEFLNNYCPEYPGCLILDVRMPGMNGLDLQQELLARNINIPIIFISGHAEIPDSARAFRAGAVDFLEKPFDNTLLMDRIKEAIDKDIAERNKKLEQLEIKNRVGRLTSREKEVLNLLVGNHSNKEVAKILSISPRTIDVHRARIMEKMEADNYTDLLTMVLQNDVFEKDVRH